MDNHYLLFPIGMIRKADDADRIEINPSFKEALMGLEGFSHVNVFYWLHHNDTFEHRRILTVHPRGDASNPLTGVFATHAPVRPNLIAFSLCRILGITGSTIRVADIDAIDGSPVLDLKCYIPPTVPRSEVRLPDWV